MKTPHERFIYIREQLNFNMERFSYELGISQSLARKIENNERSISKKVLEGLEKRFNVTKDWILAGKGKLNLKYPDELPHPDPNRDFLITNLREQIEYHKKRYEEAMEIIKNLSRKR